MLQKLIFEALEVKQIALVWPVHAPVASMSQKRIRSYSQSTSKGKAIKGTRITTIVVEG